MKMDRYSRNQPRTVHTYLWWLHRHSAAVCGLCPSASHILLLIYEAAEKDSSYFAEMRGRIKGFSVHVSWRCTIICAYTAFLQLSIEWVALAYTYISLESIASPNRECRGRYLCSLLALLLGEDFLDIAGEYCVFWTDICNHMSSRTRVDEKQNVVVWIWRF